MFHNTLGLNDCWMVYNWLDSSNNSLANFLRKKKKMTGFIEVTQLMNKRTESRKNLLKIHLKHTDMKFLIKGPFQ